MNETQTKEALSKLPCPTCQSTDYEWGSVGALAYFPPEAGFFDKFKTGKMVDARRCKVCFNIQIFMVE